jgi:hypothetical protein
MKKHNILELQKMSHEDLLVMADEKGIDARTMSKQVLIYELLDAQNSDPLEPETINNTKSKAGSFIAAAKSLAGKIIKSATR